MFPAWRSKSTSLFLSSVQQVVEELNVWPVRKLQAGLPMYLEVRRFDRIGSLGLLKSDFQ